MIAQHRMIRSACRPRIGFPLRVSLDRSLRNSCVIIGATLEHSFAREAEACTNNRATIHSFKTKNTDRARKRREEGVKRGEETRGEKTVEKKTKIEKEIKYERIFSVFCVDYYSSPCTRRRGRKKRARV